MGNCAAKRRAAEKQALLERSAPREAAGLNGAASELINSIDGSSSDLHGAASGYGDTGYVYATYCPEGIPEDIALLATAAALAAGLFIIYRQILIQTAGRKKRSLRGNQPVDVWTRKYRFLEEVVWSGTSSLSFANARLYHVLLIMSDIFLLTKKLLLVPFLCLFLKSTEFWCLP